MKKHLLSLVAISAMLLTGCGETPTTTADATTASQTTIVEDTTVEETTAEQTTADETTAEDSSTEASSAEDSSVEDSTVEDSSVEDSSVEDSSVEESSPEETSPEESSSDPTIDVSEVALNKTAVSLFVGESETLTATVTPADATDPTVAWSSDNNDVVTVVEGKLTAVGKGTANVKAVAGGKEAVCAVTVNDDADYKNIFYADGMVNDGEAGGPKGKMIYWFGEGAAIQEAKNEGNTYSLTYTPGGQWWATQFFYKGLYQEAGDSYLVRLTLNSSVAGQVTVAGQVVDVAAGEDKAVVYRVNDTASLISIQLGVNGKSVLGAGTFKLTVDKISDLTANAVYHTVNFKNGDEVLSTIPVKNGKTVTAPAAPTPGENQVFAGWYDGETAWSDTLAIEADHTFSAKFSDLDSSHTVNLYYGETLLGTATIADGATLTVPEDIVYPFGYKAGKWYKDKDLTQEFTATDTVTEDLTLYALLYVTPNSTYDGYAGWGPLTNYLSNGEEGELKFTNYNAGGNTNYCLQINFVLPIGEADKFYKVSFDQKINVTGGDVQIYDKATIARTDLQSSEEYVNQSLVYEGGKLSTDNILSFELGATTGAEKIDFSLKNLKIEEYVPAPEVKATASTTSLKVEGENATVSLATSYFAGTEFTYKATLEKDGIVTVTADETDASKFVVAPVAEGEVKVTFTATSGEESATAEVTFTVGPKQEAGSYTIPEDAFEIKDKATFLQYFDGAATYYNKNAYLSADIDLEGAEFGGLKMAGEYAAVFEGQGHTISNYTQTTQAIWNLVGASAEIRNVKFVCNGYKASGFGTVAYALSGGTMDNVDVEVTVTDNINNWGPLAMWTTGTMKNCDVTIHVSAAAASANTCWYMARNDAGSSFAACTYAVDGDGMHDGMFAAAPEGVTAR